MPKTVDIVAADFVFDCSECGQEPCAPSTRESHCDPNYLSIPSRGIVVAVLISAMLWAGIFITGHALWSLLH